MVLNYVKGIQQNQGYINHWDSTSTQSETEKEFFASVYVIV